MRSFSGISLAALRVDLIFNRNLKKKSTPENRERVILDIRSIQELLRAIPGGQNQGEE